MSVARDGAGTGPGEEPRGAAWLPLVAALAGMLACAPALGIGFTSDDHDLRVELGLGTPLAARGGGPVWDPFVFSPGLPALNDAWADQGMIPWWSAPDFRMRACHPLPALSHALDVALWPEAPALWHLHSILWYGAVCFAAALFFRRFVPEAALPAALFFAWDAAHGMPVGWISNRYVLQCAVAGLLAVMAHDRWCRDGSAPHGVVATGGYLAALACGEAGTAVGAYLFAYALCLDPRPVGPRARSMLPYLAVTLAAVPVYVAGRFGFAGSGIYADLGADPWGLLVRMPERLAVLMLALHGEVPSHPYTFEGPWVSQVHLALAVVVLGAIAATFLPQLLRSPEGRFLALGSLGATLPFTATLPDDRLVLFAGLGGFALVGRALVRGLHPGRGTDPAPVSGAWRVLAAIGLVVHGVVSPLRLPSECRRMGDVEAPIRRAVESLPSDPGLARDLLVLVSVPTDYLARFVPIVRASLGGTVPGRVLGLSLGRTGLRIARPDAQTLEVEAEGGFGPYPEGAWAKARGPHLAVGRTMVRAGVAIEILAATADGRPQRVRFTFPRPLEDPEQRWFTWQDGRFVPFFPPRPGGTAGLPAPPEAWWESAGERPGAGAR